MNSLPTHTYEILHSGEQVLSAENNKHETSSSSCGGVFGNKKYFWYFLVIANLITSFVIAYLITSFVVAYMFTSFVIEKLFISYFGGDCRGGDTGNYEIKKRSLINKKNEKYFLFPNTPPQLLLEVSYLFFCGRL